MPYDSKKNKKKVIWVIETPKQHKLLSCAIYNIRQRVSEKESILGWDHDPGSLQLEKAKWG